jgi:hypothetical protein
MTAFSLSFVVRVRVQGFHVCRICVIIPVIYKPCMVLYCLLNYSVTYKELTLASSETKLSTRIGYKLTH